MMWRSMVVFGEEVVGQDELGNNVTKEVHLFDHRCRKTPWNNDEIALLGRDYTRSHIKVITPALLADLVDITKVTVSDKDYRPVVIGSDDNRWRYLHLEGYGQ